MTVDLHAPAAAKARIAGTMAVPALEAAPRFDAAEVEARRRLIDLFAGVALVDGDQRLETSVAVEQPSDRLIGVWLWFETALGPLGAAVLRLDCATAPWPMAPSQASAAALGPIGRLEFAIAAFEAFIPLWRPLRFGALEGRCLRLDLRAQDGRLLHQLALCVPQATHDRLPPSRPLDRSLLPAAVPLPVRLTVDGPRLPTAELAALAVGDLVWLDAGRPARLRLPTGAWAEGVFDPRGGQLRLCTPLRPALSSDVRLGEHVMPAESGGISRPQEDVAAKCLDDLAITIRFELGPWPVRLGDVASMAPGFILTAPAAGAEPAVRIMVEDRAIASGRLVSLGQGHGVLVEMVET